MIGIYRMLLRLYPAEFRRAYADDMAEAFAEDLEAARRKGSGGVLRFWIFIVGDLLASAGRLRGRHLVSVCRRLAGRDVPRLPHRAKRTEMDTMLHDLRYGLRQFLRRPGFAAVAVVSLALAIGGNSLIYGIVDGFVLRLFDYPDPDRLVTVGVTFPKLSSETTYVETLSPAEYADIRAARAFLSTAAFDLGNRNLSGGDVPERVFTALLLDDAFPVRPKVSPRWKRVAMPGISCSCWCVRIGRRPHSCRTSARQSARSIRSSRSTPSRRSTRRSR